MKLFERFTLNSDQLVYLQSLLKSSFFRTCVEEAVALIFLVLWLILVYIFSLRKDKGCYPVLVFL